MKLAHAHRLNFPLLGACPSRLLTLAPPLKRVYHPVLLKTALRSTSKVNSDATIVWKLGMKNELGLVTTFSRFFHHSPRNYNENNSTPKNRVFDEMKSLCSQGQLSKSLELFKTKIILENANEFMELIKTEKSEQYMNFGLQMYDFLNASHINPSLGFLSNLMFLCNKVNPEKTIRLFFKINKDCIEINQNLFSQLAYATNKTQDKNMAKNLVEILKNGVHFVPHPQSCSFLFNIIESLDDSVWLMNFMFDNKIVLDRNHFIPLIMNCSSQGPTALKYGQQIYEKLEKTEYVLDPSIFNLLLQMFAKCGDINQAINVFETIETTNPVLWNCMIGLCAKNCESYKSVELYDRMIENNITPTHVTFINILTAISNIGPKAIKLGEQIHQQIIQHEFDTNVRLITSLIQMYDKCGEPYKSVEVYDKMIENNITPTQVTFINILTAIFNLGPKAIKLGEQIHQQIIQHEFDTDVRIINSLIQMYDKCGEPNKSTTLYESMIENNIAPTYMTFYYLLVLCSKQGADAITFGEYIHKQIIQHGFESNPLLIEALEVMYDKCK